MKYKKGRLCIVTVISFGFVALMNTSFMPIIYYNNSSSIPKGFYYSTDFNGILQRGDIVVFNPPSEVAQLAYDRGYLSTGHPMIKKVAAVCGDEVSICKDSLFVAGICMGSISSMDSEGRELQAYPYNHYIVNEDEFIAIGTHKKSWDSRYYGPIPVGRVITKVKPLYLTENED